MKTIHWILLILMFLFGSVLAFDGNKPPSYDPDIEATGQTTNGTPFSLYSYNLATGKTARVFCNTLAKSGNNRMCVYQSAVVKNISGTLTVVGSTVTDIVPAVADAALLTSSFTITTSGTNIIFQATGIAATTIDWISKIKIITD